MTEQQDSIRKELWKKDGEIILLKNQILDLQTAIVGRDRQLLQFLRMQHEEAGKEFTAASEEKTNTET